MENHRILIVEDDEAIAGAVSRIIESWGLTPRCVRDFRDVLRRKCGAKRREFLP